MKQNDRDPVLRETLRSSDGSAVNLSGRAVLFRMKPAGGGAVKVSAGATITSATEGKVSYAWGAGDTDTVGDWIYEWVLDSGTATERKVPSEGYRTLRVNAPI